MKILVADDDALIRLLLERQLSTWGHEVHLACDGDEALRIIRSDPSLEVLLLDWMMPGRDGLEVCRETRSLDRGHYTFIILMTSRTGKANFLAGMSAGADDFMTKPLDTDELRVRIHSAERVIHLQTEAQVQAAITEELREIDRMKSSFIALTSHELRSPLALILLNLELLARSSAVQDSGTQNVFGSLTTAAERLWRIVEEILKASREGKYIRDLQLEGADLKELVQESVTSVAPFAALRSQSIHVETDPDLPDFFIDRGKISDVLANLLMNAIKFTPDEMTITVRIERTEAGAVKVSVIDPGVGISDTDKPHIFERLFSTLDITHHSSGHYQFGKRGIGLGLAIAKDFVEMHGGVIGFESEEGKGSCFHFSLPTRA